MKHSNVASHQRLAARWLPSEVIKLAPLEREIATLIYLSGGLTPKDVESHLSKRISNGAVRSVLMRLIGKGIIGRRPFGSYKTYLYYPRISNEYVQGRALLQVTEDLFEGSLDAAARMIAKLRTNEVTIENESVAFPFGNSVPRPTNSHSNG